jgi:hypothetical protein
MTKPETAEQRYSMVNHTDSLVNSIAKGRDSLGVYNTIQVNQQGCVILFDADVECIAQKGGKIMSTFFRWFGLPLRLTLVIAFSPILIIVSCLSPDGATDWFEELFGWAWKP